MDDIRHIVFLNEENLAGLGDLGLGLLRDHRLRVDVVRRHL
jgi:hypothetical protein